MNNLNGLNGLNHLNGLNNYEDETSSESETSSETSSEASEASFGNNFGDSPDLDLLSLTTHKNPFQQQNQWQQQQNPFQQQNQWQQRLQQQQNPFQQQNQWQQRLQQQQNPFQQQNQWQQRLQQQQNLFKNQQQQSKYKPKYDIDLDDDDDDDDEDDRKYRKYVPDAFEFIKGIEDTNISQFPQIVNKKVGRRTIKKDELLEEMKLLLNSMLETRLSVLLIFGNKYIKQLGLDEESYDHVQKQVISHLKKHGRIDPSSFIVTLTDFERATVSDPLLKRFLDKHPKIAYEIVRKFSN